MILSIRYLDAATGIADLLVKRIQPGDANNSPWPFRVNALTGEVHRATTKDGKPISASYTTNWSPSLDLFNDLIALKHGNISRYRKCVEITTAWIKRYPLRTNKWGPFFEDIETSDCSDTEINADTMAFYILDHPDWDSNHCCDTDHRSRRMRSVVPGHKPGRLRVLESKLPTVW